MRMGCRRVAAAINIHHDIAAARVGSGDLGWLRTAAKTNRVLLPGRGVVYTTMTRRHLLIDGALRVPSHSAVAMLLVRSEAKGLRRCLTSFRFPFYFLSYLTS